MLQRLTRQPITSLKFSTRTIMSNRRAPEGVNERKLLEFLKSHQELRNNPQSIIEKIDEFTKTNHLMNIGPSKGPLLTQTIAERKPEIIFEFGTHTGYSSILMSIELQRLKNSTAKIYTFEKNPDFYDISKEIIALAGLTDRIVQTKGTVAENVDRVAKSQNISQIELLFIDHFKKFYLPDLRLVETLGYIRKGSVLFADNCLRPGAPDYVEYVNSAPDAKKHYNESVENINGHEYPGRWGLLYNTTMVDSENAEGDRDVVAISKCVDVLE